MTTDSTDNPPGASRSWSKLAQEASREKALEDFDIRVSLRAQLESIPQSDWEERSKETLLWDDLQALYEMFWLRISLAGAVAVSAALLILGAQALREIEDLLYFNGPFPLPL